MAVRGGRVHTSLSGQRKHLPPESEEEVKTPEGNEDDSSSKPWRNSMEYMRVEDVFIVPAVGIFQEDFDLDSQEYYLSCCTTPKPSIHESTSLGRHRKIITCPNCLGRIKTYTDHGCKRRALGHSWVVPFVGFCCALYAIPWFHTVRHYCPLCRVFLGQSRGLLSVKEKKKGKGEGKLITQEEYKPRDLREGEEKIRREEKRERKKIRKGRKRRKKIMKKGTGLVPIEQQEDANSENEDQKFEEDSSGSDDVRLLRHNRPTEYDTKKTGPLEKEPTTKMTSEQITPENEKGSAQTDREPKTDTLEQHEQKQESPKFDESKNEITDKTEQEKQKEQSPRNDEKDKTKNEPMEESESRKQQEPFLKKDEKPHAKYEPSSNADQLQKQSPEEDEKPKPSNKPSETTEPQEEEKASEKDNPKPAHGLLMKPRNT